MPSLLITAAGSIECEMSGNGPALLALHGGMGGWDQGEILARALGVSLDKFRIVAVSRPGYLGSPQTSGGSPEEQADLFAALLDTLDIENVLVAAVSAGGPSAIQFALRHPGRCKGLILVSCCTGHMAVPAELIRRLPILRLMARFSWLTAFMRWRTMRNPARSSIRSIADEDLRNRTLAHPEAGPLLQALKTSVFDNMASRLHGTVNDMRQFEALTSLPLKQIAVPVLVVHGTGDRVVPFEHGERVARIAPQAELMTIDGGEHVALFTHLDLIRARVESFMAGTS